MNYEIQDCIDAGTEYCPCHLAESGDCILCSQLSGKCFCDCKNWKGVCIYQEYIWNGNKAKEERKGTLVPILEKKIIENKVIIFKIAVSHKIAQELQHPGSYVFLRNPSTNIYYDVPISIMDSNIEENYIKVAVEIKGVKTKNISKLIAGDQIILRAPYWNGVLGLKNLFMTKNSCALIVMRGIGEAPSIPVIKKLSSNNNKIIALIDKNPYNNIFVMKYLKKYDVEIIECNTLKNGELPEEFKKILQELIGKNRIELIHCDGPDILIKKMLELYDDKIRFSCCNNAKMCCGEGVCGTCSLRYKNHNVKRLCKYQIDPKYLFNGRRLV